MLIPCRACLGNIFNFQKQSAQRDSVTRGGRDYTEYFMEVLLNPDPEVSYLSIFDGHGGQEAANFARKHLWPQINQQQGFYSDDKAQIVKAITEGFVNVQKEMWKHTGKLTCGMAYK